MDGFARKISEQDSVANWKTQRNIVKQLDHAEKEVMDSLKLKEVAKKINSAHDKESKMVSV